MFGFAATFGFLYTLRSPERKLDWAKFPAAVFFLIGVFILLATEFDGAIPFVISGLFILAGLYLIYRTLRTDFGVSKQEPPNLPTELSQAG
jgi:O-antigen/teichoic acid export membrane protein